MTTRIGYCCKTLGSEKLTENINRYTDRQLNGVGTTIAWLNKQPTAQAESRMLEIAKENAQSVLRTLEIISRMHPELRMYRIGSDLLTAYTHPQWRAFWQKPLVRTECQRAFQPIGEFARQHDIRLSFHPGQFVCLASDSADVVERSIEEFEYHTQIAQWMGYGCGWHPHGFKINVHVSGRLGPQGFRQAFQKLSESARNLITVENDETNQDLAGVLSLADLCPIVLDVHHHWVRTGEYITATDPRVLAVQQSWRGVRPVMHVSLSREDVLVDHPVNTLPDLDQLKSQGHKMMKLRAHSDGFWNTAAMEWFLTFQPNFDIQCECKSKNIGARQLWNFKQPKAT